MASRDFFSLDGQVALITGGGSGIGRASALAMAALGARVAITELPGRRHLADKVIEEVIDAGGEALALTLDLRSAITIPNIVDLVVRKFGRLDILVNNAGTQVFKAALELSEDEFDEVISVNLKGAFFCAQAAAEVMREQGKGCIINVASQHGVVGNVMRAPYCASKGGLINLSRALAIEWSPYGIRVNAISPTFVDTGVNRAILEEPRFAEEIATGVPLGCAALPEDVAGGICYLASPIARMVTGHNLMVDGGWTAR